MHIHHYEIPIKGVKKKTVFHFSDSHLTGADALSTLEEWDQSEKKTAAWRITRRDFGNAYNEPVSELDAFDQYMEMIREGNKHDAVVITGDTADFVSGATLRMLEKGLSELTVPYAIVAGNHEPEQELPDGLRLSVMKQPFYTVDLGDLVIAAFNDQERCITTEQLAALKELKELGKPVIVIMHVPVMTEGNRDELLKAGVYFQLNYEGCPQENHEFIAELSAADSPVAAVFTGHLHFLCISEIANGVVQYGSSQSIAGHCNVYTIGE